MSNPMQNFCIHQLFELQVDKTPDAIAVIFEDRQLTYRELNEKANQLAHYLQELGVKPETLVGICVDRSLEMIIGILGILKAGGAYVPLDSAYPQERLHFMLQDAKVPVLLTSKNLVAGLPQHDAEVFCLDKDWDEIAQKSQENLVTEVKLENLGYVIYTSGSTGKPKGVAMTQLALCNLILWQLQNTTLSDRARTLQFSPIGFDVSFQEIFSTLCAGGTLVLIAEEIRQDSRALLSLLQEQHIERLFLPFVALQQLAVTAESAMLFPENLREIITAGEQLQITPAISHFFSKLNKATLHNHYGPSESHVVTTFTLNNSVETWPALPPIGRPISNTQIYILDSNLQPLPIGEPGELYIGGLCLARGYINRPGLTAEKFIPNPFSDEEGARLYKTGDLARYLIDENIEYLGRIDHQVKIRGFRIELGEIESALNQSSLIREAVVMAREKVTGDRHLVAYVVPNSQNSENSETSIPSDKKWVSEWQQIYNATYSQPTVLEDSTLNISGWNDSYTGLPMPAKQMREWVDCTVEQILSLQPKRVLDIGCGTGMLLFRIAPHCQHYCGTDISQKAIDYVKQQMVQLEGEWQQVELYEKSAHDFEGLEPKSFDAVILNSVVQLFPNVEYLVSVLEKAVEMVAPGGFIFIGDVSNFNLLKTFHTSVQFYKASDSIDSKALQEKIQHSVAQEEKLTISPEFFSALKQRCPQISHIQLQLKRGHYHNELTRFRYDVILHIAKELLPATFTECIDWQEKNLTLPKVRSLLSREKPQRLILKNVPNARLQKEVELLSLLNSNTTTTSVKEIRESLQQISTEVGIDPENFWALSHDLPYAVQVTWPESGDEGRYDVCCQVLSEKAEWQPVFYRSNSSSGNQPWSTYANNPLQVQFNFQLIQKLRNFLQQKLPEYMVPSAFVVLESMPLSPNGKIDRKALPDPKVRTRNLEQHLVLPRTSTEEALAGIWSEVLGVEPIGIKDNFFELGGHSLLAAQILAKIEKIIDIALPIFYLLKEPTISGLIEGINVVQNLGSAFPRRRQAEIDWQTETTLDPTIQPSIPFTESTSEPQHIFLTGATGFLGAFLLDELLRETSANIYCLVRASSFEEGLQKIQANLKRYLLWNHELASRIIPVIGDLSQPLLGLTEEKFQILASKLDLIYHSGAFVNLVYSYTSLRSTNVLGTQEILRLASQGQVTPVHYISTIDVLNPLTNFGSKVVEENARLDCVRELDNGYTQTKWVAEHLIVAARSRGIPTCIYRPGMIAGHSQTGASQIDDLMCRIIKGIIQLKAAPDLNQCLNMTPIDYACKAIVYLSRQPKSLGQAFHIINPEPLSWKKLIEEVINLGYIIQLLPHEEWQEKLIKLDSDSDNALIPMRSLFTGKSKTQMTYLETFLSAGRAFSCQKTIEILQETSIICPRIDNNLLKAYFSYFVQNGFPVPHSKVNIKMLEIDSVGEILSI
jgi:amino acid adenylation domain-containing protein/thioester reductase-like protein